MRLGLGIALIRFGTTGLLAEIPVPIAVARYIIEAAAGVLMLVGLWTPIIGALAALDLIWIAFLSSSQRSVDWLHIFFAVLAASVAMLGPGVWSIDARLFGRRRLCRDRNRGKKPSF